MPLISRYTFFRTLIGALGVSGLIAVFFTPHYDYWEAIYPVFLFALPIWHAWNGYCYFGRRSKVRIYCDREPRSFVALNVFLLFLGLCSWQQYRRMGLADERRWASLAEKQTRIGAILPLSGELAGLGSRLRDGVILAAEERNTLVFFEDASNEQQALSALLKLTSTNGIRFILGPVGPAQTLKIAPIAEERNALVVAVTGCDVRFSSFSSVFCLFPESEQQIAPLIASLDSPAIQSVAYIGEDLPVLEAYRNRIRLGVRARGKKLVLDETFRGANTDFRPLLRRIQSAGVDVLAIGSDSTAALAAAFRQARALGLSPKARWSLWEDLPNLSAQNADILEGTYSVAIPPTSPEFAQRFHARFGYEPDLYSSLSYDGAATLIGAMKANGDLSRAAIQTALKRRTAKDSATAGFRFDSRRNATGHLVRTRIRDGAVGFAR